PGRAVIDATVDVQNSRACTKGDGAGVVAGDQDGFDIAAGWCAEAKLAAVADADGSIACAAAGAGQEVNIGPAGRSDFKDAAVDVEAAGEAVGNIGGKPVASGDRQAARAADGAG